MRVGIAIEETWRFLSEIYEDLARHHHTNLFKRRTFQWPIFRDRINRYIFTADMQTFMRANNVVFFEWASGLLATATRLKKQSGIVTRLHRYEMYRWADSVNWDVVDRIILVSQAKKQEFIYRFPEQKHKVVVIPEAVDLKIFQPRPRRFNGDIGILCDLTPRKRVYELILTFFDLIQKDNSLHLHIGGGAHRLFEDYYLAIQDLIKKLNMQDKVILYGNVSDPHNWYHNIDIFISNSYSEGLQVAPMEAMASGCYCLSHYWAGADELLPDNNLFISEFELQEKILRYSKLNEGERQSKRKTMREIVAERFNIDKIKVQIRQVIEEVGMYKF
jgi:glycosyltransferase involved in cell wall biosynthesis